MHPFLQSLLCNRVQKVQKKNKEQKTFLWGNPLRIYLTLEYSHLLVNSFHCK